MHSARSATSLLALIFVLTLTASTVDAATVQRLSLSEIVTASDVILVGTITAVTPSLRKGRVFTTIAVHVEERLKGDTDERIEIVQLGGRTADLMTYVPGMPGFDLNEKVLLFLEKPQSVTHYVVTGLSQGKYRVSFDEKGLANVEQNIENLHLISPPLPRREADTKNPIANLQQTLPAVRPAGVPRSLNQMLDDIRLLAAEKK
jgi:hypothetical protein